MKSLVLENIVKDTKVKLLGLERDRKDFEAQDSITQVVTLKLMSLISNDKLQLNDGLLSKNKAKFNAQKFLKDVLNPANPTITNSTKQIIINLNEFERLNKESGTPNNWTTTAWDRDLSKIGYVVSISGKEEKDTISAFIEIKLLEAISEGKYEDALKSLIEYTYFNNKYEQIIDSLNIVQGTDNNILDFSNLDAFITRYKRKAANLKERSISEQDDDLSIYAGEANIIANMISIAQSTGNINTKCSYGNTLLHRATYENDVELIKELIKCNIDLDLDYPVQAIAYALSHKYYDIVEELLKAGTNINFMASGNKMFVTKLIETAETDERVKKIVDTYIVDKDAAIAFSTFSM